jgi:hypothetical protein
VQDAEPHRVALGALVRRYPAESRRRERLAHRAGPRDRGMW